MKRLLLLASGSLLGGCSLLTNFSGIDDGVRPPDASDASLDGGPTRDAPGHVDTDAGQNAPPLVDDCTDGGACVAILARDRGKPLGIDVEGNYVYWVETDSASMWRADRVTGAASRVDFADDAVVDPFDVAVEGSTLYWTERTPARIASRPLAGGARANLAATGATALAFLTISGGTAFATDFIASKPTTGNVYRATTEEGGLWVNQPSVVAGIASQFEVVHWTQAPSGAVLQSSTAGTPDPVYVGYPEGATSGLAIDGVHAFVVEDQHELVRFDIKDGSRTELFDFGESIGDGDLAVDENTST